MSTLLLFAIFFGIFNLAAAEKVAPSADPQQASWAVLDQELAHGTLDHKLAALDALATIPGSSDRAVKRVESALKDPDPQVRKAACEALGKMKAEQAVPYLKQSLGDSGEVAFAAAKALTDIGDPSGQSMLVAVLAGERKDAPGMMTNAMRDAKKKLRHPQSLVVDGAQDAGGAVFPPAGAAVAVAHNAMDLKGKGAPGRAAAADYIAKQNAPNAANVLEWALSDESPLVRAAAAKGLGACGNAGSIPKLQKALTDEHTRVKTMAAAAIIRIQSGQVRNEASRSQGN